MYVSNSNVWTWGLTLDKERVFWICFYGFFFQKFGEMMSDLMTIFFADGLRTTAMVFLRGQQAGSCHFRWW